MKIMLGFKGLAIAALLAASGCGMEIDASRGVGMSESQMASGPAARRGEGIILGKDDVIRVEEMSTWQYNRQLGRMSREFQRAAPHVIAFTTGQSRLDDRSKGALDQQADWILAHPQVRVSVTGIAATSGNRGQNTAAVKQLERAAIVYLVGKGVDREQIVMAAAEALDKATKAASNSSTTHNVLVTQVFQLFDPTPRNDDGEQIASADPTSPTDPTAPSDPTAPTDPTGPTDPTTGGGGGCGNGKGGGNCGNAPGQNK